MTRKEMEQCRTLPHEIKSIEMAMKNPRRTDVVVFYKDYRTGTGVPKAKRETDDGEEDLKILRGNLNICKRKLAKRLLQAEKFIEEVDDTEMRTILRMYYINNTSQKEIGELLHYSQTAISTKLRVFWFSQGDKDKSRSHRRK
ncbi:MAG: DUF1492 domain-containing protein [Mogibacterium sp.]|nr:DUF1492 domain-containing protein [Mogibacterium sp.]